MKHYDVTFVRCERITLRVEAVDEDDAAARYLSDGDEVSSTIVSRDPQLDITEVEPTRNAAFPKLSLNAWPDSDLRPCVESGEHHDDAAHPLTECPTYNAEG